MHPSLPIDYIAGIPMTQDERLFFKQLGARIAELRFVMEMIDTVLAHQDR
jgi:hypothetical protein